MPIFTIYLKIIEKSNSRVKKDKSAIFVLDEVLRFSAKLFLILWEITHRFVKAVFPTIFVNLKFLEDHRAHVSQIKIWRGIPDDDEIIVDDKSEDDFEEIEYDDNNEIQNTPTIPENVVNEGKRARKKPAWLNDYI